SSALMKVSSSKIMAELGWVGRVREGTHPEWTLLATPAGAAAAHTLVATAVADHDRAADVATGCVSEVDEAGQGVGGVDGRTRPGSWVVVGWQIHRRSSLFGRRRNLIHRRLRADG